MFKFETLNPMISCEEAARLISLSRDTRIGFFKKIQLRLHLLMCDPCNSFSRLVNGIGKILQTGEEEASMPETMRDKLQKRLKKR